MAPSYTTPGVFVDETPSGARRIVGVATAVTAFVGRAPRGPVNIPCTIAAFTDFERLFGGLRAGFTMGHAVRDYFTNGGKTAVIVRLYHADPGDPEAVPAIPAPPAVASFTVGGLTLSAVNPGVWGVQLQATIERAAATDDGAFDLTVTDIETGISEIFRQLTVTDGPRRIDALLARESVLMRCAVPDPLPTVPVGTSTGSASLPVASDGLALTASDFVPPGGALNREGLFALERLDHFSLLCIPPYAGAGDGVDVDGSVVAIAAAYCEARRAMLILDAPSGWTTHEAALEGVTTMVTESRNVALYFPRLRQPNPVRGNQMESFAACGAVAGVYARTDLQRGVWKAPAGLDATLDGVPELSLALNDSQNGALNRVAVNCLRAIPVAGRVVWGARTRRGADAHADEYRYVPVRRTALFIEESLRRGLQWVVFEPNDEPLWARIRLTVGAFLNELFVQGAFQGSTPAQAYFVTCDATTTTADDVAQGVLSLVVGFAPLRPAEFVIIRMRHRAGSS